MKKLLGSTFALALLVPAVANAQLLKNFKMSGSLEVDAVDATNVTDFSTKKYDNLGTVQTRLMVHADWDVLDDVHAHVSIDKNNRTYGTGAESLTAVQGDLTVDESYVKIDKLFGALDTTIGRQYYGEPGDLVVYFGPKYNLYGMGITALDGGRFDWNGEKTGVTLLASKVTGSAIGVNDNANKDLYGADVHFKPTDNLSGSVYGYDRTTINSGARTPGVNVVGNDYLYLAGLRGKVTMGGAWAKAEFDKNFGSNRTVGAGGNYTLTDNYTGWAGLLDLGYKADISNVGALTGWAQGGIGSGGQRPGNNFQSIAGDYRPGSIWGRFATGASSTLGSGNVEDSSSLTNLVVIGAGVKATPSALSKLTAGLSWWNFRAQNETAYHIASAANTQGNVALGNEYDLDLTWAHSENVTVSAGVGDFQPGRAAIVIASSSNGGSVSPARLGYADLSIKF
ncbi:MAG TPA: hypothetical protein VH309_06270 [Elusimicrobiota bacterium]|nr:hypothetical protein [Elusimicrobiota bacterium]